MKIKNRIVSLLVVSLIFASCYKDLGNYKYREINELEVLGIDDVYARDLEDSLVITPTLKGTQYSDTSRFNISWVLDGKEKSQTLDLRTVINTQPGRRDGSITLTDRKTSVRTTKRFIVNVSSSTAGDLYMILSKSKGKAELSYLRLDKPSNFAVNFYEERTGTPLGVNPQQLCMIDLMKYTTATYPFSKGQGRIVVLVDNKGYLFDKHILEMDKATPYLTLETYTSIVSYPPVEVDNYSTEFTLCAVEMWRVLSNNVQQEGTRFFEISGGSLYRYSYASNANQGIKKYNLEFGSSYPNAYMSPFGFFDEISDAPKEHYLEVRGNTLGNLIVFDKVNHRFGYHLGDFVYEIKLEYMKAFPDYDLMWGTHTNQPNLSLAILANESGSATKMVLINKFHEGSTRYKYTVAGEVTTSSTINRSTKFATLKNSTEMFYTTGNKLYLYNILEASLGTIPSERNVVAKLTEYGYDESAVITDITISRTQRTILLGVSRYGSDTEAMSEENKGDLVVLDLDASMKVSLREIHKGVCGIPVDVQIKYQQHFRDGKYADGTYKDNI